MINKKIPKFNDMSIPMINGIRIDKDFMLDYVNAIDRISQSNPICTLQKNINRMINGMVFVRYIFLYCIPFVIFMNFLTILFASGDLYILVYITFVIYYLFTKFLFSICPYLTKHNRLRLKKMENEMQEYLNVKLKYNK